MPAVKPCSHPGVLSEEILPDALMQAMDCLGDAITHYGGDYSPIYSYARAFCLIFDAWNEVSA